MSPHNQTAPDNLQLITAPSVEPGQAEFYLSEVTPQEWGDKDWGFSLYGNHKLFIVQFLYGTEGEARRGAVSIATALRGAVYVGLEDADAGPM